MPGESSNERRERLEVGEWTEGLARRLGEAVASRSRVVSVAQFDDGRYVQFWVEPDVGVIAEVIANSSTGGATVLSAEQEGLLRAIGFVAPAPRAEPNWHTVAANEVELVALVARVERAVGEILGEGRHREVRLRTWTMARDDGSVALRRETSRVRYRVALEQLRRDIDRR